jgi:hypothetical protein
VESEVNIRGERSSDVEAIGEVIGAAFLGQVAFSPARAVGDLPGWYPVGPICFHDRFGLPS